MLGPALSIGRAAAEASGPNGNPRGGWGERGRGFALPGMFGKPGSLQGEGEGALVSPLGVRW